MFFTKEDIYKIQAELSKLGVKDSQFPDTQTIDRFDTLVLTQGGRNVKIRIIDFLEQLNLLVSNDFINVTVKFDAPNISLIDAIRIIPASLRKTGLVITFCNMEGNWEIVQYTSTNLNQWNEETAWEDCKNAIDAIAIPDEEDLTVSIQGNKAVTKFKDKIYDPENFSGLGKVYLRKNITEVYDNTTKEAKRINLLTQAMIGKENTIYIIQYDYNLNGQELTIPENCVLKFEGGSLSNGTLVGNIYTTGKYVNKLNVLINGHIVTPSFVISNYDENVNKSLIESCINGIIIKGSVNINETVHIYTSILGEENAKIIIGDSANTNYLKIMKDNISISKISIIKTSPLSNVDDVDYSRVILSVGNSNITIDSCFINQGIKISGDQNEIWEEAKYISNIQITNNTFLINFTNIIGNIEDDVIMFVGCRDSTIIGNKIDAINVNRVIKLTGIYRSSGSGAERIEETYNDIKNVSIKNNIINSVCNKELTLNPGTGKQVIDLYCNPYNVDVCYNTFNIINHTDIIENKSVQNKHTSIIDFHDNIVTTNSSITWICDKHCILNMHKNNITFEGNYYGNYVPFRIMAIKMLSVFSNTIIDNIEDWNDINYLISINYSSNTTSTIFNSFYNPYYVSIKENNIILNNILLLYALTYDNTNESFFDFDKLGSRIAKIEIIKNDIEVNPIENNQYINLYNIKTIIIEGNKFFNINKLLELNGFVNISEVLNDTIISDLYNVTDKIKSIIVSPSNVINLVKNKFKQKTLYDGNTIISLEKNYSSTLSVKSGGMHVIEINDFFRNFIEIITTNTGTGGYKILLGITNSAVNILSFEGYGNNYYTAISENNKITIRQYALGTWKPASFSTCKITINNLLNQELNKISISSEDFFEPTTSIKMYSGISDNSIAESYADNSEYSNNVINTKTTFIKQIMLSNNTPAIISNIYGVQKVVGNTDERPKTLGSYKASLGFQYYDTDLNNIINWDGYKWLNNDGTLTSKVTII